jgi:hypothetical protein
VAITYSTVFMIALVNPILCLLHCAFTHNHSALSSEQQHFLCDLGRSAPTLLSEPFSAVWSSPQAVYQALQLATPVLTVIIVLMARFRLPTPRSDEHFPLPEFPPPKVHPLTKLS